MFLTFTREMLVCVGYRGPLPVSNPQSIPFVFVLLYILETLAPYLLS